VNWYLWIAYFFGGVFAANALPHLIFGVTGRPLQTPFASPPFEGLSSPIVNVAWALFNLVVAYVLLVPLGELDVLSWPEVLTCFAGFGAMSFQCARSFRRLRDEGASRS
jgi:hypothetical protein